MAAADLQVDERSPKRRKVRKGTQSCWECKRRKVRCIFTTNANAVCDNCKRRGTACLSQEVDPDDLISSASGSRVETRLGRVEELVEQLVNNTTTSHTPQTDRTSDPFDPILTPAASADTADSPVDVSRGPNDATLSCSREAPTASKHEELVRNLLAAWPSQRDLDLICTLPVGISAYILGGVCKPDPGLMGPTPFSSGELVQPPPPGSHPVLVARKLLTLGLALQGVIPSSVKENPTLGASYRNIMTRVVEKARLVTTNDDLICCVEGVECILFETLYHNYGGRLHKAWMSARRAITVAQLMALPRGLGSPSLRFLTPETRAAFDADAICFRLVQADDYLSLMLGLPRNSLGTHFTTPKALEQCQPIARVQRMHCAIAGRILQRNQNGVNDLTETKEIDRMLQNCAAEMPPKWWMAPDFSTSSTNPMDYISDTSRIMDQFMHYHLLIRLYLPFMLRPYSDHRYSHGKIAAINASRETLTRFISFRTSNPAHYYCRGSDFLVFVAATVLCIAHIDYQNQRQGSNEDFTVNPVFSFLGHSRPSDRGIMERALEIIGTMTCDETDPIAPKIFRMISHVLTVEASAANGIIYNTGLSKGDDGELECDGKLTDGGNGLHIHIPYFGSINFERGTISRSTLSMPMSTSAGLSSTSVPDSFLLSQLGGPAQPNQLGSTQQHPPLADGQLSYDGSNFPIDQFPSADAENGWGLEGVDVALFDSLFSGTTLPDMTDESWTQWMGNGGH